MPRAPSTNASFRSGLAREVPARRGFASQHGWQCCLRAAGHDCAHVYEVGLGGQPDERVMAVADRDGRILISADTDFGELLANAPVLAPSVILLRRTDKSGIPCCGHPGQPGPGRQRPDRRRTGRDQRHPHTDPSAPREARRLSTAAPILNQGDAKVNALKATGALINSSSIRQRILLVTSRWRSGHLSLLIIQVSACKMGSDGSFDKMVFSIKVLAMGRRLDNFPGEPPGTPEVPLG